MSSNQSRFLKAALTVYFLFAAYVFLRLRDSAPAGYELSLYRNTPWETWLMIGVTMIAGLSLIVWQALSRRNGNAWVYGFLLLMFGNLVVVTLWILRGYFDWYGNDHNAHFGMATDYLNGIFNAPNIYPTLHMFVSQAQLLMGVSLHWVFRIFPAFLTCVVMLGGLVLARAISPSRGARLLAIAGTSVLLYGLYHIEVYPRGLGQVMLPAVIWLYFLSRSQDSVWIRLSLVLVVATFVFVHPIGTLFVVLMLGVVEVCRGLADRWSGRTVAYNAVAQGTASALRQGTSLALFFLAGVTSFLWFSSSSGGRDFNGIVNQVALSVSGKRGSDWLAKAQQSLEGVSGWEQLEFFAKIYGPNFLMWSLLGIAALMLARRWWKGALGLNSMVILVPWLIAANVFWVPFFAFVGGSAVIETNALSSVAAVFVGWALYHWFGGGAKRSLALRASTVVLIIGLIAASGFMALYRSPYLFQGSPQMLRSDVAVSRWLLSHKLPFTPFISIGAPYSVVFFIFGKTTTDFERSDLNQSIHWSAVPWYNKSVIPPHFGYDKFDTIGEQWGLDKYVILTDRFDQARRDPTLQRAMIGGPSLGRLDFDEGDLSRWEEDHTLDRLYDNGVSRLYIVRSSLWR